MQSGNMSIQSILLAKVLSQVWQIPRLSPVTFRFLRLSIGVMSSSMKFSAIFRFALGRTAGGVEETGDKTWGGGVRTTRVGSISGTAASSGDKSWGGGVRTTAVGSISGTAASPADCSRLPAVGVVLSSLSRYSLIICTL